MIFQACVTASGLCHLGDTVQLQGVGGLSSSHWQTVGTAWRFVNDYDMAGPRSSSWSSEHTPATACGVRRHKRSSHCAPHRLLTAPPASSRRSSKEGFWGSSCPGTVGGGNHPWNSDIFSLFILYILMEFCGPDLVLDSVLSESAKVQRGGRGGERRESSGKN